MTGPSKDEVAVLVGEGFDPHVVEEGGGADAVAAGVGEGDAVHGTDACVVESLESAQKVLAQAPDLVVVQQDSEDKTQPLTWRSRSLLAETQPGALQRLPMRTQCACRLQHKR